MLRPEITNRLHIFTLSAFAFAQPLYDLLGKNAEFFPVRNNGAADILTLALFLSLLIPTAFVLAVDAGSLVGKRTRNFFHVSVIALLFAIITLPILKKIPAINTAFTTGFSCLLSVAFAYLYLNRQTLRLFLTYLSPAVVLFPLLFLFNSPVYHLLMPTEPPQIEVTDIKSETPIVMIIFDELPISTLMSGKNQLDNKLFPGFASLANDATWYPNTTTVAEYTIQAVPAILTGKNPSTIVQQNRPKKSFSDHFDLPAYQHHPENLFTALSEQYELRVFETVSSLCPEEFCQNVYDRKIKLNQRMSDLLNDLYVVYLHIIMPRQITKNLPRIDMNWNEFVRDNFDEFSNNIKDDDVSAFDSFIDSLTHNSRPTLYFHHSTLPHGPWKFLPSGRRYNAGNYSHALTANQKWSEDADIREPFQRHLLQTMFADSLLQKVIIKLKKENLYDESIIIVTADHGASFLPGEGFRVIDDKNYSNITDVPLFIKRAGQKQGSIDITHLQTIDIIPTLFYELGEKYPWDVDGQDAGNKHRIKADNLRIVTREGDVKHVKYDPDTKLETIKFKTSIVGNNGANGIYGGPRYAKLIGTRPEATCNRVLQDTTLLGNMDDFNAVEPESGNVPSSIKVHSPFNELDKNELLAISVNNRISAVFEEEPAVGKNRYFFAMIDDRFFKAGNNHIGFYAVDTAASCHSNATQLQTSR